MKEVIGVIGLGYVGLPIAIEFGKNHSTIGFDISSEKINHYIKGFDMTGQITKEEFEESKKINFTNDPSDLKKADFLIICVPTPVDKSNQPDFTPLISASEIAGRNMKRGAIVIYESTVYPGATEEICVPVLEKYSNSKWKKDFFIGYSPERINPGDKEHTLIKIKKIVSGDTKDTLNKIKDLYSLIIKAGVYCASSIAVAEAAKVIENTQRDINIALINEFAIIFNKCGIDTLEVLEAAGTKWNFLPFRPGLVGGHCIGVDPYYLTHKAQMEGIHPHVILSGRFINDGMGKYIAEQTVKQLIHAGFNIKNSKVNILGLTFKEDCPDLRNSKVIDIISELKDFGLNVFVHDYLANPSEAKEEYGIDLVDWDKLPQAEALILAVSHKEFINMSIENYVQKINKNGCFIDVKSKINKEELRKKGLSVWRL